MALAEKPSAPSVHPSSTGSPLVLSSALPPIPAKVMEKVAQGQFIDFKDLLADNMALQKRLNEVGIQSHFFSPTGRLRVVQDPLTWVSCFLAYMSASIDCKQTRSLAAYGMIVIHLARKHGGKGWLAYDNLFRQQMAAGAKLEWAELCPSLMAATVIGCAGNDQGRVCSLCMASDHISTECALGDVKGIWRPWPTQWWLDTPHPSYGVGVAKSPSLKNVWPQTSAL